MIHPFFVFPELNTTQTKKKKKSKNLLICMVPLTINVLFRSVLPLTDFSYYYLIHKNNFSSKHKERHLNLSQPAQNCPQPLLFLILVTIQ